VSDERHEEIAARLRAEAGARAPERLQADVMLRVRAEPRPRRIRQRRRSWRPLGSLAAAACVLAALVLGLSHLNISSNGSASEGATSAAALKRAAAPSLNAAGGAATETHATTSTRAHPPRPVHLGFTQAQALRAYGVPRPLRYAILGRLALNSPLPKALGTLDLHRGHGSH
jgi:hypothetical protein